jgi:hypothetical protein
MSYLTPEEQAEIKTMEDLFASEGWRLFVERNASPEKIDEIRDALEQSSELRHLGVLQGQINILRQIQNYEEWYMAGVDQVERERADLAKLSDEENEEMRHAESV